MPRKIKKVYSDEKVVDIKVKKPDTILEEKKTFSVFFQPGVQYAVTINPDDRRQYFGAPTRFKKFTDAMYEELLKLCNDKIRYSFFIELSEPRDNTLCIMGPRLHLHGVLQFDDNKSVRNFLLRYYCQLNEHHKVKFELISDITEWRAYCTKQLKITGFPPLENATSAWDPPDVIDPIVIDSETSDG